MRGGFKLVLSGGQPATGQAPEYSIVGGAGRAQFRVEGTEGGGNRLELLSNRKARI